MAAVIETWGATNELRWFPHHVIPAHVEHVSSVQAAVVLVLQQKWVCYDNGRFEWRDVPTVTVQVER